MNKTIVSLGVDCGVANFLKENGLRNFSLPFDWVVSYGGVSNILKNKFSNYIPKNNLQFNRDDNVKFIHENFPADIDKMNRRIDRFLKLLDSDGEIIFLRKGHSEHHHTESEVINDDLLDCEELYDIIKQNYKNLKFKIILFLVCSKCYNYKEKYHSEKVIVYNVSDKSNRSDLIKNYFSDLELQTGIQKELGQSFVNLNL
tara:strand:- start:53 stop:655 length:603 start_codon:yes stop_codon:yes gene_type:complete